MSAFTVTALSVRGGQARAVQRTQRHRGHMAIRAEQQPEKREYSNETKLRSEAQAPFRVLRQFLLGAVGGSALIGGGISFIQLVTGALGAPSAPPVSQSSQNFAIDFSVLAVLAFFYKKEDEARERQMSRISREERLGDLRVELATGKIVKLVKLRGFARVVIAAGPAAAVAAAIEAAEPYKEALLERGVLLVPFASDGAALAPPPPRPAAAGSVAEADAATSKRWRATPLYSNEWSSWLNEQMGQAKLASDALVYVSLRMDGRVRASGKGSPPWEVLAASLPRTEGVFGGFLDGMDGKVGET